MRSGPPINAPECPFCGAALSTPKPGGIGTRSQFDGGVCPCGAVFGSDPRGSNLGALLVDVLVCACGGDWDLVWELQEGEDYDEAWLYGYYERLHHLVLGTEGPRRGIGTLYLAHMKEGRLEMARNRLAQKGR